MNVLIHQNQPGITRTAYQKDRALPTSDRQAYAVSHKGSYIPRKSSFLRVAERSEESLYLQGEMPRYFATLSLTRLRS
jgi:hypothetical protein